MKTISKLLAFLGLCMAFTAGNAFAQTNIATNANATFPGVTNIATFFGLSSSTSSALANTASLLLDATPYITNGDMIAEVGALSVGSHYGLFLDIQLPLSTNSWQMTYGVTAAYLNRTVYSGALNVTLGTTVTVPFLSNVLGPFYAYVESGPGYNFEKSGVMVQSFAGVKWQHAFNANFSILASGGLGTISDVSGSVREGSLGFAFHTPHW